MIGGSCSGIEPVASWAAYSEMQVNHPEDAKKEQLRYLFYEFWMLAETHKRLLAGIGDTVIQNALIEAFCTHAHNLNNFFLEVGWDDTLKASDLL
jgi:hypothetical protein